MKFFERIFKKAESEKKTESNTVENEIPKKYVKLKDEFDRDLTLDKDVWIKDFLKPALQKNWNNLEVLYSIVLDAFNNDIFAVQQEKNGAGGVSHAGRSRLLKKYP